MVDLAGVFRAEVGPLEPAHFADHAIAQLDAAAAGEAGVFGLGEALLARFGQPAGRAAAPGIVGLVGAGDRDDRNEEIPDAHRCPPDACGGMISANCLSAG